MITGSAESSIFSTFPLLIENPMLEIKDLKSANFD